MPKNHSITIIAMYLKIWLYTRCVTQGECSIPHCRTQLGSSSFSCVAASRWNALPTEYVLRPNPRTFSCLSAGYKVSKLEHTEWLLMCVWVWLMGAGAGELDCYLCVYLFVWWEKESICCWFLFCTSCLGALPCFFFPFFLLRSVYHFYQSHFNNFNISICPSPYLPRDSRWKLANVASTWLKASFLSRWMFLCALSPV